MCLACLTCFVSGFVEMHLRCSRRFPIAAFSANSIDSAHKGWRSQVKGTIDSPGAFEKSLLVDF